MYFDIWNYVNRMIQYRDYFSSKYNELCTLKDGSMSILVSHYKYEIDGQKQLYLQWIKWWLIMDGCEGAYSMRSHMWIEMLIKTRPDNDQSSKISFFLKYVYVFSILFFMM
jgi:hypothetical protein